MTRAMYLCNPWRSAVTWYYGMEGSSGPLEECGHLVLWDGGQLWPLGGVWSLGTMGWRAALAPWLCVSTYFTIMY
jgi:hypothetical protein